MDLGQVPLVLGLQSNAPFDRVFELLPRLFQYLDRFGVRRPDKRLRDNRFEIRFQALLDETIEHRDVFGIVFQNRRYHILQKRFRNEGIVVQIRKCHFRLDHPEFCQMTRRIRVFRSKCGTKRINVPQRHRVNFTLELPAHGQIRPPAKKVLRIISLSFRRFREFFEVQRRDLEHFTRAFAIEARENRRVNVEKSTRSKEIVHRHRQRVTYTSDRAKRIRTRTQMRNRAQKVETVTLLLQREIIRGKPIHLHGFRLDLDRLPFALTGHHDTFHPNTGTRAKLLDVGFVIGQCPISDDLQILQTRAVVDLHKGKIAFGIATRANPAAHRHPITNRRLVEYLLHAMNLHGRLRTPKR
jgi:hypothetical protein